MTSVVVALAPTEVQADLVLLPGRNLVTGEEEVGEQLGELTSMESDLLRVAASVFASDLATRRGEREGFMRSFELEVPVTNLHAFRRLAADLSNLLYVVSDDNWSFRFTQADGTPESAHVWPDDVGGQTLLFSGGLDSLAAAVDRLEGGVPLQLASHYTANPVIRGSQNRLFALLAEDFRGVDLRRVSARITGHNSPDASFPRDDARETSQRTRSLMFLALAAIAGRRTGFRTLLLIAENGQMAIHLPLTAARIGAFSTHTAHPQFVHETERFLSELLNTEFSIQNPYLYLTKAETIAEVVARHGQAAAASVSCWRSSRQAYSHCGECVPCLVRRIALLANGLALDEYQRDLFVERILDLPADDLGKINLLELAEFVLRFRESDEPSLIDAYPELINQHVDTASAIAMYRRFAIEAEAVFSRTATLAGLLA
jgi:7-cyano-7-deazaguanine synthase in queuosine biosynthesis